LISCPSCSQPVEITDKHLGTIFTCPHCNAVYFIDWNGQPEIVQHELSAEMPPQPEEGATLYSPPPNPQSENDDFGDFEESNAHSFENPNADGFESPPPPPDAAAAIHDGNDINQEEPFNFSQTLDEVPFNANTIEPAIPAVESTDNAQFNDVVDFANSTEVGGPITYTVIVEGIESSHLFNQLKEAITDSKFGWDARELLTQVGGGRLVLSKVSPGKAAILISRLKVLPLRITWRQDVFSGN
jgi:hypothetical protein